MATERRRLAVPVDRPPRHSFCPAVPSHRTRTHQRLVVPTPTEASEDDSLCRRRVVQTGATRGTSRRAASRLQGPNAGVEPVAVAPGPWLPPEGDHRRDRGRLLCVRLPPRELVAALAFVE